MFAKSQQPRTQLGWCATIVLKTTGFGSWELQNTKKTPLEGSKRRPGFCLFAKRTKTRGRGEESCVFVRNFMVLSVFLVFRGKFTHPPISRRTNQYSDSSHGQMALKQEKSCSDADQNTVSLALAFLLFLPVLRSKTGKHQPPGVRRLSTTNGIFVVVGEKLNKRSDLSGRPHCKGVAIVCTIWGREERGPPQR